MSQFSGVSGYTGVSGKTLKAIKLKNIDTLFEKLLWWWVGAIWIIMSTQVLFKDSLLDLVSF